MTSLPLTTIESKLKSNFISFQMTHKLIFQLIKRFHSFIYRQINVTIVICCSWNKHDPRISDSVSKTEISNKATIPFIFSFYLYALAIDQNWRLDSIANVNWLIEGRTPHNIPLPPYYGRSLDLVEFIRRNSIHYSLTNKFVSEAFSFVIVIVVVVVLTIKCLYTKV